MLQLNVCNEEIPFRLEFLNCSGMISNSISMKYQLGNYTSLIFPWKIQSHFNNFFLQNWMISLVSVSVVTFASSHILKWINFPTIQFDFSEKKWKNSVLNVTSFVNGVLIFFIDSTRSNYEQEGSKQASNHKENVSTYTVLRIHKA